MRHMLWATSIAALLAIAGTPMLCHAEGKPAKHKPDAKHKEAKAAKEKAPKSALYGEYAAMAKELNLSPEQTAKLEAIATDQRKAIHDWKANNGTALTQAAADAKSDDAATKKAGKEKSIALRKEMADANKTYADQALAILTPEQRATWESNKLIHSAQRTLKRHKIVLTDEQNAKVKQLAADAIKGVDTNDAKAMNAASKALDAKIKESVLTSDQVAQIPAPKARAPKAGSKTKNAPAKKADDAAGDGDNGGGDEM